MLLLVWLVVASVEMEAAPESDTGVVNTEEELLCFAVDAVAIVVVVEPSGEVVVAVAVELSAVVAVGVEAPEVAAVVDELSAELERRGAVGVATDESVDDMAAVLVCKVGVISTVTGRLVVVSSIVEGRSVENGGMPHTNSREV